ncbi:unnamed protein product [Symbiodinium microadriaticum]|nr:unnamed protein product [Symbiodinium microadriaticum]
MVEPHGPRAFLATEVLRRRHNRTVDLWALAVTGHFALTARLPNGGGCAAGSVADPTLWEPVAVKVQRPDVREQVTLDLFVVRKLAAIGSFVPIERYARQFKSIFELVDRAAPPFIEELDYEFEADNQREFAELISKCELVEDTVVVPEVLKASREVLVQEWLPGKKLTEEGAAKDQSQEVVKVLLNSYMVQLLETGFLHGDPHPGNFVLMPTGKIGILDYGLMTRITPEKRVALIEYLIHVQANMYDECLQDLVTLEFLPEGIATDKVAREVIVPRLAETLNILFEQSDLRVQREKFIQQREELEATGKLEVLQEELQNIAKKYGTFELPSYATLIIRALATLEGVGLRANKDFSLSSETFPYIARRLLTDDGDRIRKALKAYLYKGRARMAPDRLESIARGFRTFTNLMKGDRNEAVAAGAPRPEDFEDAQNEEVSLDAATKDIAAVVFSPDGNFLQDLLIDEGVAAVDALSRAAVSQVLRILGPLGAPVAAPMQLILGSGTERLLTREDKQSLLVIRKIVQIIQAGDSPGLATADSPPKTIEDPTKISLPCNFAENLPSQRVLNKFPYRPGFLPALRVAKARGLCLKNLDFVLDDISLGFLATRKQPQKRFKHLVQKLPGTDVIVLGVHGLYMRELHEIGFQFERLMTGQPLDSPHDLCWHGAIQLLDIGGWQVLIVAEVDAMNSRRMPVEIKSSKRIREGELILQMLSSGAVQLVHAKRNGNTLEDVQLRSFEELVAAMPKSWIQRVDKKLVAGLSQLKASGDVSADLVHEVASFSSNSSMLLPCTSGPARDFLPSAQVVKQLLRPNRRRG